MLVCKEYSIHGSSSDDPVCIRLLFCGDLAIPYLGLAGYCFLFKVKRNCATTLAGYRAAILFNLNLLYRYGNREYG